MEELLTEKFILPAENTDIYSQVNSALAKKNLSLLQLDSFLTLSNAEAIALSVQKGLGLSFSSKIIASTISQVVISANQGHAKSSRRSSSSGTGPNSPPLPGMHSGNISKVLETKSNRLSCQTMNPDSLDSRCFPPPIPQSHHSLVTSCLRLVTFVTCLSLLACYNLHNS